MSIFDLDNYTDAISDAIDAIGDAGDLIGAILKTVAPFLGTVPGIGTGFAVAVYAAGAIAAKDKITDAAIGTASAAMPPGVPRIAFDGATAMTRDVVEGRSALDSAIGACRQAAGNAGGAPAAQAFDAGLAAIKGGKIDQRVIDQGRAFALETGGQAAAASYDAGVAIAQNKGADQVLIDVAGGYVNQMGGSVALTAFETAVALGYGKTLQEAGYIGLHTFAKGNTAVEKILNFVEQVGQARSRGISVQQVLEGELSTNLTYALSAQGAGTSSSSVDVWVTPYTDAIRQNLGLLEYPAGELAKLWTVDEAIVRSAQALLRHGDGTIDQDLLAMLKAYAEMASRHFDTSEKGVDSNDRLAVKGRQIIASGAKWRGILLSDILKGNTFTMTHLRFDSLSQTNIPGTDKWQITDECKRGFEIGIGTAEGTSQDNPDQVHTNAVVRSRLGQNTKDGFDAGEAIQFERTKFNRRFQGTDTISASSILTAAGVAASSPQTTTAIARAAQVIILGASRTSDEGSPNHPTSIANKANWTKILVNKAVPTAGILGRDEPKLIDPIPSTSNPKTY